VVILCVTGSPQVEAVILAEDGLLKGIRPGMVVIDCSTALPHRQSASPAPSRRRGDVFLDAPMTRTPKEAAEGRLNLLVGGDAELFDEVHPLLSALPKTLPMWVRSVGHRMKRCINYVSLGSVALLAEAAACALRAGIAPEAFIEVLAKGGGGGKALERITPYLLARDGSGLKFAMPTPRRTCPTTNSMAEQAGAVRDIGQAVLDTFTKAAAIGPRSLGAGARVDSRSEVIACRVTCPRRPTGAGSHPRRLGKRAHFGIAEQERDLSLSEMAAGQQLTFATAKAAVAEAHQLFAGDGAKCLAL